MKKAFTEQQKRYFGDLGPFVHGVQASACNSSMGVFHVF